MAHLHDAMTLAHIYLISVSINRMLISQLKRFVCVKFGFHLDSMFNLSFVSHFCAVVIRIIQTFQSQDVIIVMLAAACQVWKKYPYLHNY